MHSIACMQYCLSTIITYKLYIMQYAIITDKLYIYHAVCISTIITDKLYIWNMQLSAATGTLHNSRTAQGSWSQYRQREAG